MTPATSSHISEQAVGFCSADQSTLIENFADLKLTTEDSDATIRSQPYPHYNLPYRGLPAEIRLRIWRLILPSALEAVWDHLKLRDSRSKWRFHQSQGPYVVTEPRDKTSYILNSSAASKGQAWRRDCCNQQYLDTQALPPLTTIFNIFHVNKTIQEEACEALQWVRPHLILTDINIAQMQSLLSCLSPCASFRVVEKLTITDTCYDEGRPCHTGNPKHMERCPALALWRQTAIRLRVNVLCLKFFNEFGIWAYEDVFQTMEPILRLRTISMDAVALVLEGAVQQLQLVIDYDEERGYRHRDPNPWAEKHKNALQLESLSPERFQRLDVQYFVDQLRFRRAGHLPLVGEIGFMVLISLKTATT